MSANLKPTIKRSRAAALLDKTTRTMARYEALGILTPIKLNCRSVVYYVADVQRIMAGKVSTAPDRSQSNTAPRSKSGTFAPRAKPQTNFAAPCGDGE